MRVVNNAIALCIADGFFAGKSKIDIPEEKINGATFIVKGVYQNATTDDNAELMGVHVAMLVDYSAWPTDRTSYSMTPIHVGKSGDPQRWLEFILWGQEDPNDGYRSSLDSFTITEVPALMTGWSVLPPTEVDVKQFEEMFYFNLAECPPGHDGTPQALIEMGTLRHDEYYPTCRLSVDISVIPANRPVKQTLNMDAVIAESVKSEDNPGWGDF